MKKMYVLLVCLCATPGWSSLLTIQAANGDQAGASFQVLTEANIELDFQIFGAPTADNCSPIDPSQTWGCLGFLSQTAVMGGQLTGFGDGGAQIDIEGEYDFICTSSGGCVTNRANLEFTCDGGTCGGGSVPCGFSGTMIQCTTNMMPGIYSIVASDSDFLNNVFPDESPGNSIVLPYLEDLQVSLIVNSGSVVGLAAPEPASGILLLLGLLLSWSYYNLRPQRG